MLTVKTFFFSPIWLWKKSIIPPLFFPKELFLKGYFVFKSLHYSEELHCFVFPSFNAHFQYQNYYSFGDAIHLKTLSEVITDLPEMFNMHGMWVYIKNVVTQFFPDFKR